MAGVMVNVTIDELRRAYKGAGRKMGRVEIEPGKRPTYLGREIAAMNFGRYKIVEYIDDAGKRFARFQDGAAIDD